LLNSYCRGTGYKAPLTKKNFPHNAPFLKDTRKYLLQLKRSCGEPLHKSDRSTFVVGLIVAIESLERMMVEFVLPKDAILA
jgi:hypothetical protein